MPKFRVLNQATGYRGVIHRRGDVIEVTDEEAQSLRGRLADCFEEVKTQSRRRSVPRAQGEPINPEAEPKPAEGDD